MKPSIRSGRVALALLILILASGAFPEGAVAAKRLATLEDISAAGVASSLDYAKARNAAAAAAAAVPALVKLKSSTISTTYAYDDPKRTSVSASLPIIDQVGLSASLSQELSSSVSATLNPLSHSDARTQAQLAYRKALAAADDKGKAAGTKAVKAALAWMSQKRQLDTQERLTAHKKDAYDATKAGNALDGASITLDDLMAALKDWSDARTALVKAQGAVRNAETTLYSALGSTRGDAEVVGLDLDALAAALASLEASLAAAPASGPAESYAARAASLDVESGAAKAAAIWAFEPGLAINGGFSFGAGKAIVPAASLTLTLSLDDLKGEKKVEAEADLEIARKTLILQKSADANAYDQALAAVQAATLNSESRKLAREQSAELAEVAAFNFKSGSYSALEDEAAALALIVAADDYYQALVDEYSAWLDLGAIAGQ